MPDPNDLTALTLHIRHRRRNLALGVVGGFALLVALIVGKYYLDKHFADVEKAALSELADATADTRSPAELSDVVSVRAGDTVDVHGGGDSLADVLTTKQDTGAAAADVVPTATPDARVAGDIVTTDQVTGANDASVPDRSDVAAPMDGAAQPDGGASPDPVAPTPAVSDRERERKERREAKERAARDKKEAAEMAAREEKLAEKAARDKKERSSGSAGKSDDGDLSGSFDSLMAKGDKARKSGNYKGALNYFKKALSMKPSYAEPNYKVAECHRSMGNCSAAVGFYDKAISISGVRNAYIGIAKCYRQMGEKALARKYLEQGIEKYNDGIMRLMLEKLQ